MKQPEQRRLQLSRSRPRRVHALRQSQFCIGVSRNYVPALLCLGFSGAVDRTYKKNRLLRGWIRTMTEFVSSCWLLWDLLRVHLLVCRNRVHPKHRAHEMDRISTVWMYCKIC